MSNHINLKDISISIRMILILFFVHTAIYPKETRFDYRPVIDEFKSQIPVMIEKCDIPGLSVALVNREGLVWTAGFGYTDDDQSVKVDGRTLFSIQSMSKYITSVSVLIAVEKGILELDVPIVTYIPEFKINSIFETGASSKITLRHLLSHRSGLEHEAPVGNNFSVGNGDFKTHIDSIFSTWLKFPVGQRYSYSNLGIDLAGYVLQRVSGRKFHRFVKDNLFIPLGMRESTFNEAEIKKVKNRAWGHGIYIDRPPSRIPIIPSGGMYTNAEEMGRFIRFNLNDGSLAGKMILESDRFEVLQHAPLPVWNFNYSYGLGIVKVYEKGSYAFTHSGGGFGFNSFMKWFPEYDIGLVLLTNCENEQDISVYGNRMLNRILKMRGILPEPLTSGAALDRIVGNYRIDIHGHPLVSVKIEKSTDGLILTHSFQGTFYLKERRRGLFFSANGELLDTRKDPYIWRNIQLKRVFIGGIERLLIQVLIWIYILLAVFFMGKALFNRFRADVHRSFIPDLRRLWIWVTAVISFSSLIYLQGIIKFAPFVIYSGMEITPRMPFIYKLILYIPYLYLIFDLLLLTISYFLWKRRYFFLDQRIFHTVFTGVQTISVAILVVWRFI